MTFQRLNKQKEAKLSLAEFYFAQSDVKEEKGSFSSDFETLKASGFSPRLKSYKIGLASSDPIV